MNTKASTGTLPERTTMPNPKREPNRQSDNPEREALSEQAERALKKIVPFLENLTDREFDYLAYEVLRRLEEVQPEEPFSICYPDDPTKFLAIVMPALAYYRRAYHETAGLESGGDEPSQLHDRPLTAEEVFARMVGPSESK